MGNKIRFTMKRVLSGVDSMDAVVLDTDYRKVWSGEIVLSGTDLEIDIGTSGTEGQEVWVYCRSIPIGVETSPKVMGGYSSVGVDSGWYNQITGMITCSNDLLECNGEIIECL